MSALEAAGAAAARGRIRPAARGRERGSISMTTGVVTVPGAASPPTRRKNSTTRAADELPLQTQYPNCHVRHGPRRRREFSNEIFADGKDFASPPLAMATGRDMAGF